VRGLSSLAWRSLLARPLRSFLTVAGVALGVAVLFASLAAGATMDAAVEQAAADELGNSVLRVQALEEKGLTAETVALIDGTAGVAVAAPALERKTYLDTDPDQSPLAPLPPPLAVLGVDPVREPKLHPLTLAEGRLLSTTDAAAALVSQTLAEGEGFYLGGTITLKGGLVGPTPYRIVGIIAGDGPVPDAGGRLVILALTDAQTLFGSTGVTRVDIGAEPGTSVDGLMGALEDSITTEPYLLARASDVADSLRAETAGLAGTLLLVAAVVLFAGAFLIFNTLSMTVAEQSREVGLLRAAGATRSQVMGIVLLQALSLGVVGSLVGTIMGMGFAALTLAWVSSTGSLHLSAPDVSTGSIAIAVLIGVLVTLAASLEPAWRAGRIPPVEALRRGPGGAAAGAARLRWLVAVFVVLALAALALWPGSSASTANRLDLIGHPGSWGPLAVYSLLLGAVLILPRVLGPLLFVAGIPFRLLRNEERLARSSLARDRSRTALTAGALVVGLAMVVALGTAAQNVRLIGASWLAETIPGSEILTSINPVPVTSSIRDDLAASPGVTYVSPIGFFAAPLEHVQDGRTVTERQEAAAIVGADYLADGRLVFVAGDRSTALIALDAGGAVIVPQSLSESEGIELDDRLVFVTGRTPTTLRVVGIARHTIPGESEQAILVGWSDASGPFGVAGADFFAVRYASGQEASARAAVDALARQNALEPANLDRIQGAVGDALGRIFRLLDALALIAVLVAGLGMVNTFSMSVFERVREIGVLRATGMTSRQVWTMVVVEAGVLGLAGALVGTLVGLVVGAMLVALSGGGFGLAFEPPWAVLALALLFGVLVSITAAIYPAGRASRYSIVRALQHE
jgi:putative ABC transport system permease protein